MANVELRRYAQMSEAKFGLANIIPKLSPHTAPYSERRLTTVRWINRLYYDIVKWQRSIFDLLSTYPSLHPRPTIGEFKEFYQKISELEQDISEFELGLGTRSSEICARLDFLAARLALDFRWLKEEDPHAFEELADSVRAVRGFPGQLNTLSFDITRLFHGARELTQSENRLTKAEAEETLLRYKKESDDYIRGIEAAARRAGITLLTVEEYELALSTDGSRNPQLIVMGEVTMSGDTYNTGQAAAVGRNAQANNTTMVQNNQGTIKDLPGLMSELGVLRAEMKKNALDADHDVEIGAVALAEKAAKEGNAQSVLEYLKNAGTWALEIAQKIGVEVAAAAIKHALGLPAK
jgi:hypothetical protein